jgi:hypothetical protein
MLPVVRNRRQEARISGQHEGFVVGVADDIAMLRLSSSKPWHDPPGFHGAVMAMSKVLGNPRSR